jgi:sterol 3beta-glucosyltransferase
MPGVKIALTTFGSEGDVRPFIALGAGLRRAGHDAYLVAADPFRARAEAAGVPFRSNGMIWDLDRLDEVMRAVMSERNPFRQTRVIFSMVEKELRQVARSIVPTTADADFYVTHQIDAAGQAAAEIRGRPRMTAMFFHGGLPMRARTMTGGNLGPLNRTQAWLFRTLIGVLTDGPLNASRAELGLPRVSQIVARATDAPPGALLAVSPQVIEPDPLWKGRYHMTGYWFLEEPAFQPSPELEAFLAAGPPPVVIGFGSMSGTNTESLTRMLVDGLRRAGRRAILQAGWSKLGAADLGHDILCVDYVPHGWLFERASCVVHHGGAGTTAAVLRAGKPQVIVWHLADQPLWGKLLQRRGLAPAPVNVRGLTGAWLNRALDQAHADAVVTRARAVREAIRAEDGVGNAVAVLSRAIDQTRHRSRPVTSS